MYKTISPFFYYSELKRYERKKSFIGHQYFLNLFGRPNEGEWTDDKVSKNGFGLTALKTVPKGFPKDYEHLEYLRMKDYCCWVKVSDDFFEGDGWLEQLKQICKTGKPMMDFINNVVDDYE